MKEKNKDNEKNLRITMSRRTLFRTLIVKLRMWYADIRGHHGKRWDYEPGDYYMGSHKGHLNINEKNRKLSLYYV